jgi:phage gpG-like protein
MLNFTGNWDKRDLGKAVRKVMLTAPLKIGEVVVQFSNKRFEEENWIDRRTETWPRRQPGTKRDRGRRLLVDTGRLRRSIRIQRTTEDQVVIGTDVPYASAHNDGFRGTVTVKAHTRKKYGKKKEQYTTRTGKERSRTVQFETGQTEVKSHSRRMNLPRRRFLGESEQQNKQIVRMLAAELNRALRS